MLDRSWLIWQLIDSALPTGGFAHSNGLEAAWQMDEVRSKDQLRGFAIASLAQTAFSSIPLLAATHASPDRLLDFDERCDAFTSNHVANRASRLQGRALWNLVTKTILVKQPMITHLPNPAHYHLAPVFGAVTCAMGLELVTAARMFSFQQLRTVLSSAVRLGIIGPMEAQELQYNLSQKAEETVDRGLEQAVGDVEQVSPLLEIWQGNQDRLYSRLFQS